MFARATTESQDKTKEHLRRHININFQSEISIINITSNGRNSSSIITKQQQHKKAAAKLAVASAT
jgi:hypothetical protein